MGYPAGGMKPWHFVSISFLNCLMNVGLIIVMTPVLACFDYKNDKVSQNFDLECARVLFRQLFAAVGHQL